jgi:hypothetical protein
VKRPIQFREVAFRIIDAPIGLLFPMPVPVPTYPVRVEHSTDTLARERAAKINLLPIEADAPACGHANGSVVERVIEVGQVESAVQRGMVLRPCDSCMICRAATEMFGHGMSVAKSLRPNRPPNLSIPPGWADQWGARTCFDNSCRAERRAGGADGNAGRTVMRAVRLTDTALASMRCLADRRA